MRKEGRRKVRKKMKKTGERIGKTEMEEKIQTNNNENKEKGEKSPPLKKAEPKNS